MKEVHYWIANDGTEFEDEQECYLHELADELFKVEEHFCFYDKDKVPIAIDGLNPDDVWYIKVDDEKAIEPIEDWFEAHGTSSPFKGATARESLCGIWAYRDTAWSYSAWVNLVWELADLQCELKDFGLCR